MKRGSLAHLTAEERQALDAYIEALKRETDGELLLAALFGSKARGDADEDSDVDILLVTDAEPEHFKRRIDALRPEFPNYELVNKFVFSREQWADYARRRAAFWQNIQRDGIALYRAPVLPEELTIFADFDGENIMADHRPEIQRYIRSARESLDDAQFACEQGRYRTAANRAYYAVFYAANAMLATMGLQRAKHSGVKSTFQEKFVKTGQIEASYSDDYEKTMESRETSDYKVTFDVTEAFARDCVERAERFVGRVEGYLEGAGCL